MKKVMRRTVAYHDLAGKTRCSGRIVLRSDLTMTHTAGARIDAKSLKFSEKYIMLPALTRMRRGAYFALAGSLLLPASAALAQTTVLPPAQQTSDFQEASVLLRNGQYDRALERVDAWLKTRPKDARGRFLRGMILTQQKKLDDAARIYTDLTQDFPELPEPYNNLAVIYAERGDLERARGLLESAVRANARFTAAHENLGDLHTRLAAASYEQALKLDASNKAVAAKLKAVNDLIPARAPVNGKP
jgi:Flp pilus assembly protein TadD